MFGLGTWEIAVILIAALIFIGPAKLPDLAKTLGKGMRDLRRAMAGFDTEVKSAIRDVETPTAPRRRAEPAAQGEPDLRHESANAAPSPMTEPEPVESGTADKTTLEKESTEP